MVFLLYIVLGACAGVLAGLLGIGGGLVIVPVLHMAFTAQGLPEVHIMHLALGTSLATILFTSVSSVRAHNKRGAVNWDVVKSITVGILLGTWFGTWVASSLSTNYLRGFFVIFLYYVGTQMLLNIKPKPSRQLPGAKGMLGAGGFIGLVSSLVGIGGGTLSVPFLTWCNQAMHTAIGTAAAIGFPIAFAGATGFLFNGLGQENLPDYTIGYIYIPALVGIAIASTATAPFGAKLAHSLPVSKLKKVFAVLLYFVGTRMLLELL